MNPIKRIMAAIGDSPHSHDIFIYAAELANRLDARIIVVSVINRRDVEAVGSIESMGYKVDSEAYINGIRKDRLSKLNEMAKEISLPKDRMEAIIKVGHPFNQLMEVIREQEIDLVVMGTKGRSNLPQIRLGSVADKLIRHSPVPVISFRKE